MDVNMKINNVHVIGTVKINGTTYYVDMNKVIYIEENGEYVKVKDKETLTVILDYISPQSIDVR